MSGLKAGDSISIAVKGEKKQVQFVRYNDEKTKMQIKDTDGALKWAAIKNSKVPKAKVETKKKVAGKPKLSDEEKAKRAEAAAKQKAKRQEEAAKRKAANDERKKKQAEAAAKRKAESTKNFDSYEFEGNTYNKGRMVHAVMKAFLISNSGLTTAKLVEKFPKEVQGSFGVFAPLADAQKLYDEKGHKRYYINDDQVLKTKGGKIAICNQWSPNNIEKFIEKAAEHGFKVKVVPFKA